MAEELKKHVSEEALQEALKVVKNNMPGVATADKPGLVKPGSGLNVDSGVVSVDDSHVNTLAQQKVDAQKFKAINGQSIKGEGEITIDLSPYAKTSELEALCMTAADGKALAEGIFGAEVE